MATTEHRPRPLRRHWVATGGGALQTDTYLRLKAYAQQHNLAWSGAIHELLRTHPLINLPSLPAAQQASHPSADSLP